MAPTVNRESLQRVLFGREVAVAFATLAALYVLMRVPFPPTQVPGYLLVVAYDAVERVLPALSPYWPVGFPAFLYLLAVVAGAGVRWVRSEDAAWHAGVGAGLVVVGILGFGFALAVGYQPADEGVFNPFTITVAAGVVLVAVGAGLLSGWDGDG